MVMKTDNAIIKVE